MKPQAAQAPSQRSSSRAAPSRCRKGAHLACSPVSMPPTDAHHVQRRLDAATWLSSQAAPGRCRHGALLARSTVSLPPTGARHMQHHLDAVKGEHIACSAVSMPQRGFSSNAAPSPNRHRALITCSTSRCRRRWQQRRQLSAVSALSSISSQRRQLPAAPTLRRVRSPQRQLPAASTLSCVSSQRRQLSTASAHSSVSSPPCQLPAAPAFRSSVSSLQLQTASAHSSVSTQRRQL